MNKLKYLMRNIFMDKTQYFLFQYSLCVYHERPSLENLKGLFGLLPRALGLDGFLVCRKSGTPQVFLQLSVSISVKPLASKTPVVLLACHSYGGKLTELSKQA